MRFLMLNWRDPRNPASGGAERVSLAYLSGLAKRGHEVYWFTHQFDGALHEETIEGVRIVRAGKTGSSILHARRWCRSQPRFDLVIDQHHGLPWFAPWWCGTRCVAYIHEVLGPIWNAFYPWPLSAIGRWQERWTLWFYRRVPFWTGCQSTRNQLRAHGVERITIISYGIATSALAELEPKPLVPPLRLVAVSRLAPNKRVDHAVHVLRRLLDRKVDASLKIIGTGESEAEIKEAARALGVEKFVSFLGALPEAEKDACLREAHFLIHTSQREGWGLNATEANAMGTPAAVYPVEGLTESTLHDRTGIVVERETPESLVDALVRALAAPERYQFYRGNAWRRAQSLHWDAVLPKACAWLEQQARGE